MRIMLVRDEERSGLVEVEVTDEMEQRMAQLRMAFDRRPDLFGFGAGDKYGKRSAQDAVEANNFAVSQLAYVESKVYETQYAKMRYEELIGSCISYAAGEGATSVEYEVMDQVGMGRRISPSGGDIPYADVASARVNMPVANGGIGYRFFTEELRNAAFSGRPLPMKRMMAAQTGWRRHMNVVALQGEAASNFTGLFNNAGVTSANRPSGAVWDAATADTIISDLQAGLNAVKVATKDNDYPTRVAMPISSLQRMQIPRSTNSDTTVQEFMERTNPGLKFVSCDELATLGSGSTKRVVFFNPIDENMVLHLPMPQRFLAPQFQDLEIKIPGEYKYGGLNIRRVKSCYYMDGV